MTEALFRNHRKQTRELSLLNKHQIRNEFYDPQSYLIFQLLTF